MLFLSDSAYPVVLFVSDLHVGRDAAGDRAAEADLIGCLRAHADAVEHVYLVGDLYDEYIEYRHLVPRGLERLKGLLAEWTDRGVRVTYLTGNHDPWHRAHFADDLGVEVVAGGVLRRHVGRWVYVAHGDALDPTTPLYRRLRPLLRHPLPVALYKYLLPGDSGFALARRLNRRFHDDAINPERVAGLRRAAARLLGRTRLDLVVMGHSHQPDDYRLAGGHYLNLGAWYEQRTFARLDTRAGARLLRWNGRAGTIIEGSSPACGLSASPQRPVRTTG